MNAVTESPVLLTDAAALKVKGLLAEEDNQNLMLRVFASGGGCSGRLQYGFTFDDEQSREDTVLEHQGIKMLIDPASLQMMQGASIDYQEGASGPQFVINNPNSASACGSCSSGCSG